MQKRSNGLSYSAPNLCRVFKNKHLLFIRDRVKVLRFCFVKEVNGERRREVSVSSSGNALHQTETGVNYCTIFIDKVGGSTCLVY